MEGISNILKKQATFVKGDYIKDGLTLCGICKKPKEKILQVEKLFSPSGELKVKVLCDCEKQKLQDDRRAEERNDLEQRLVRLRQLGVMDGDYKKYLLANDDKSNNEISSVCRNYVNKWQEMKEANMGILFYGAIGTGKTFLSCAIANALIDKLVPVCITNLPRMLNLIQNSSDKQGLINQILRYDLLIIDDLGSERDTSYAVEQIYNIIDNRARIAKPTIITTNLSIQEMQNAQDIQYRKIYDRVLEMCPIRIMMDGSSRRIDNAANKRKEALKVLWGGNGE